MHCTTSTNISYLISFLSTTVAFTKQQQQQHAVHHTSGITKLIMANFNLLILYFLLTINVS